jgi:anaerobic selenocysteine-containing dehydrogenase/ferredoxin-NADP reductase
MAVEIPGFCTLCRSRCGTINTVEKGRLVGVMPNPAHPTGKAICPKGRAAPEIAHSARRLTSPLRRTNPKGALDPGWQPISWGEALSTIAENLSQFRKESGPESVAFAVTSGSSSPLSDSTDWIQRFIRGFGSPNNCNGTEVCNWHKDRAHAFTFGCGLPVGDFRNSDLIILWGHNPANVWLSQAEAIGAARARGAKLVVIDPRYTASARNADLWLRIKPGTDAALAMGVARSLISAATFDKEFILKWSNGPLLVRCDSGRFLRGRDIGWENTEDFVVWDQSSGLPRAATAAQTPALQGDFTIEARSTAIECRTAFDYYREAVDRYDTRNTSDLTGIDASLISRFAELVAKARSVSYHGWTGLAQHTNATQTERAIASLYSLTGSFDAPGGNVILPSQPVPQLHSMEMMAPAQRAKALGLEKRPLGPPAEGAISSTDLYDAIITGRPYHVRALFAFGANLLISHPSPTDGEKALRSLEFYVHCDLFENPTSEFADIVLPVSSPWENENLRIGFEISQEAQELIQLRRRAIEPLGLCKSDLWIVFQLAIRLGLDELFFGGDVEKGFEHLLAPLGLDLATLRSHPEGVRRELKQEYRKYRSTGFATQTSRIELYSERLLSHGYSPVPIFVPPDSVQDQQFPLKLLSTNNGYFCHSQHRGINSLRRRRSEPLVEIHPDTAECHNIKSGDWVEIETAAGQIVARAALSKDLALDQIASDYGWWDSAPDIGLPAFPAMKRGNIATANFNSLISDKVRDPISGALPLRSAVCRIKKYEDGPWQGWRKFIISDRISETPDDVTIRLTPSDNTPLPQFRPGQFVSIRINDVVRSYSLTCASEDAPASYEITVRRLNNGIMSTAIHALRIADMVEAQAPSGQFALPVENKFPVVLIAGGIGITPFMSYLRTLKGGANEPSVTVFYLCRDSNGRPFLGDLRRISQRLANVRLVTHLSSGEMSAGADDRLGRLSVHDIDEHLIQSRARFYICAPTQMVEQIEAGLIARGVPAFEVFKEKFSSQRTTLQQPLLPRQVVFAKSGGTFEWTPNSGSLLEFAEAKGVVLANGCRVGQCESCSVGILKGEVHHLIEVPELEDQTCLTCQAIPSSDVILDA